MRSIPALVASSVVALTIVASFSPIASASSTSSRDGKYTDAQPNAAIHVSFNVTNNGRTVTYDAISCNPNAALVAQGATAGESQIVPIAQPLPGRTSAGGNIAYSATVTLTPEDTQSSVSVTTLVELHIHFLSLKKAVPDKSIVATGTVFVPSVCSGAIPLHFQMKWNPSIYS